MIYRDNDKFRTAAGAEAKKPRDLLVGSTELDPGLQSEHEGVILFFGQCITVHKSEPTSVYTGNRYGRTFSHLSRWLN